MPTRDELQDMTVDELRELASDREIEGRSKLDKDGLVDALAESGPSTRAATVAESPEQPSGVGDPDDKGYIGRVPDDDTDYSVRGRLAAQEADEGDDSDSS